jgi:hypothetical protein
MDTADLDVNREVLWTGKNILFVPGKNVWTETAFHISSE